jgi:hypothetical protein
VTRLLSLSRFWTSKPVGDPCSEHVEGSVISSEDVYFSEEERSLDGYEPSVPFGEHDSECHLNGKALHTLKRKRQSIANMTANLAIGIPPSENVGRPEHKIGSRSTSDSYLLPERYGTDRSPADVDDEIMECITKPHDSKELGDVYVFKQEPSQPDPSDSKSQLLKIGCATTIYTRKKQLRTQYRVDLVDVEGDRSKHVPIKHFERAERLAQVELWNFRYKYPWSGEKRPPVGYTEWFLIDTETAVRVVQRWRNFVSKDPYDKDGKLKDYWRQRFNEMEHPGIERHDDHLSRHKRWDWFVSGFDKNEEMDRRSRNPSIGNKSFTTSQTLANTTTTWIGENDTTKADGSVRAPSATDPTQISTGTEGTLGPCQNFAARHWRVFCTVQCFLWLINALNIWPYFNYVVLFAWLVILWVAFKKTLP